MNLESYAFTLNRCLVIGENPITRNVYVFSHFEPSGLRCELTVGNPSMSFGT